MNKGKRGVVTMTGNGIVTVPGDARMNIAEIADLFGIYYREAKRSIRTIEKSGIVRGDNSMGCVFER